MGATRCALASRTDDPLPRGVWQQGPAWPVPDGQSPTPYITDLSRSGRPPPVPAAGVA